MKMKRTSFSLIITVFVFVVLIAHNVIAAIAVLPVGVGYQQGYFTNYSTPSSGFGAVIQNCNGDIGTDIFDSSLTDKTAFINKILTFYNNGAGCGSSTYNKSRNATGAEFIIQTMRKTRSHIIPPVNGYSPDIEDWKARVNNGDVTMSFEYSYFPVNSGYTGSQTLKDSNGTNHTSISDDAYYNSTGNHDSLVFRDSGGNILYQLKSNCANPNGGLGLPDAVLPWSVQGYSYVKSTGNNQPTGYSTEINSYPGNTLHFSHYLDAGTTNAAIANWLIRKQSDNTTFQGSNNVTGTGIFVSANDGEGGSDSPPITGGGTTEKMTYPVTQSDVGGSLCQQIEWGPPSSSSTDPSAGAGYACAHFPYNFSLATGTRISVNNQYPDQSIIFQHQLINNGPTKTDQDVQYNTRVVRVSSPAFPSLDQVVNNSISLKDHTYNSISAMNTGNDGGSQRVLADWFDNSDTSYLIAQADVDNWICGYIAATPNLPGGNSPVYSYSCQQIPYKYTLTPSVSTDVTTNEVGNGVIDAGVSFNVSPKVNNSGPTKSKNTKWRLAKTIDSGASSDMPPSPVADIVFQTGDTNLQSFSETAPDLVSGTKICYILYVQADSETGNNEASSSPACLIIGKKPKVQIWGGNLRSIESSVQTSISLKNNVTFGSWIEYGIFAVNSITGAGSGSAYSGIGMIGNNFCDASKLSFTNINCSSGSVGQYHSSQSMPDVAASFPANVSVGMTTPISGTTIGGVTIGKGQWAIVNAIGKGTIKITGDIKYTDEILSNISDIPQLVIIADNIDISGNVTNIDAWLITKNGYINTCSDVALVAKLSNSICQNALTVNGPVMAKQLWLRRTAGSGIGLAVSPDGKEHSGDPAEIFNLRADAYLWAAAHAATSKNRIQTVYTTELPPRF